ncbi:hypothetical protein HF086_001883 [Spodoptera exigua]|uniref:XRRM domain-containing protein n=1 Tax=Spodoptera exigua TaxID=7107 RepID=A0A922M2Y2_SPOEX|nr:hypothetical protein HF086_001883 [Spodoptera exigua]
MCNIGDRNIFEKTDVHEYSDEIQNNNNIEYKTGPQSPETLTETQIIKSFDDLKITEWPGEIDVQQYENISSNTKDKDKRKGKDKVKRKKETNVKQEVKLRTVHDPICVHHIPLEPDELDPIQTFAPILRRKKKKDGICTPDSLIIDKNTKTSGYDSDETNNEYVNEHLLYVAGKNILYLGMVKQFLEVPCGRQGMCKCRRMQGRQYYDDYIHMKGRDYLKLYCHGKREFPRGTVLHFTGAPENLRREDLYQALKELDATIKFLDYQRGSTEGWIRLSYPYEARVVIKKMEDRKLLKVGNAELIFNVISGKEEKKYLKKKYRRQFICFKKWPRIEE